MAKLSIEQAPAPSTPRLFLLTASAWAAAAGALLAFEGSAGLASRWGGVTLALVHVITLGFLGNAMFGSLLQFLPVAAGVRVRGGRAGAWLLHGLLNVGTLALVVGLRWPQALPPWWGGVLLGAAFALLASLLLPGVLGAAGQRLLRWGMGAAVAGGVVTAGLGVLLTLGVSGALAVPVSTLTDVHAAWGLLGWVVVLLAAVSRVVGPMFQGVVVVPGRWHGAWQAGVYAVLLGGLWSVSSPATPAGFRIGVAVGGLLFAATLLLMQARSPRLRKAPLTGFWMAGLACIGVGALALLARWSPGASTGMFAGVLVIGIGLPLLVVGMQMEIVAFLGWIGLHRQCGKGVRLPGVQLLLPERDKYAVLALHVAAGAGLMAAVLAPMDVVARLAGIGVLLAHGATFAALCGVGWRSHRFVKQLESRREHASSTGETNE